MKVLTTGHYKTAFYARAGIQLCNIYDCAELCTNKLNHHYALYAKLTSEETHCMKVKAFLDRTKAGAHAAGEVRTLAGRRRPIKAIHSRQPRCSLDTPLIHL